jgi:hypothetical protein
MIFRNPRVFGRSFPVVEGNFDDLSLSNSITSAFEVWDKIVYVVNQLLNFFNWADWLAIWHLYPDSTSLSLFIHRSHNKRVPTGTLMALQPHT